MPEFVSTRCSRCKELFGLHPDTYEVLKRSSATFVCPHGHQQHFPLGKSETERLRDDLEAERRRRQSAEQSVAFYVQQAKHEQRRAAGYKGQAVKLSKRAKAGVCPCCNRTVSQLARHMQTQHPDYSADVIELDVEQEAMAS